VEIYKVQREDTSLHYHLKIKQPTRRQIPQNLIFINTPLTKLEWCHLTKQVRTQATFMP